MLLIAIQTYSHIEILHLVAVASFAFTIIFHIKICQPGSPYGQIKVQVIGTQRQRWSARATDARPSSRLCRGRRSSSPSCAICGTGT